MWAYLGHVAQLSHPPTNPKTSKLIDDEERIFEFIKGDLRLLFFYGNEARIILSHGFIKGSQDTPLGEVVRARKARAEYFAAKRNGKLRYVLEDK